MALEDLQGTSLDVSRPARHGAVGNWSAWHRGQRPAAALRFHGASRLELWVGDDALARGASTVDPGAYERRMIQGFDEALEWLAPLTSSPDDFDAVRRLVARFGASDLLREHDPSVVREAARLVVAGRLMLMRRGERRVRTASASPAEAAPLAFTPSMLRERPGDAAPPSAPPPVDPFESIDQDMQAAVLLRAAEQGAPFCEECAKGARRKAAATRPEPAEA